MENLLYLCIRKLKDTHYDNKSIKIMFWIWGKRI